MQFYDVKLTLYKTMRKNNKTKTPGQMISDIKKELAKTQDPMDRENLKQRLHHWYQVRNSKSNQD